MWHRTGLLLLLLTAAPPPITARPVVRGVVLAPDGKPFVGARVELLPFASAYETGLGILAVRPEPPAEAATVCDAAGRFALEPPRSGPWRVTVRAEGFVPMHYFPLVLVASTEFHPLTLTPDRGASLRALDAAGEPFGSATIWAVGARAGRALGSGGWRGDLRSGRTDAQGRTVVARADGESLDVSVVRGHRVVINRTGFAGGDLRPATAESATRLEILGRDGAAVAGVLARAPDAVAPWGISGFDGRLSFQSRPSEVLLLGADGWRHMVRPATAAKQPLRVVHSGPLVVTGRVIDAARWPLADVLVWSGPDPGIHTRTDSQGRYQLPVPDDPGFRLQAEAEGRLPQSFHLTAAHLSGRRTPTVALQPAATLEAVVSDRDGKPLAGALAELAGARRGKPRGFFRPDPLDGRGRSDGEGRLRIEGLEDGLPYDLRLSLRGFVTSTVRLTRIETDPAKPLRLALAPARGAFGRLADEQGRPVVGGEAILTASGAPIPAPVPLADAADPDQRFRGRSGLDGRFEVAEIPADEIQVTAFGDGYAPVTVRGIEVPASAGSEAFDLGTVILVPGRPLDGRVVDPEGEGIADAAVHLVQAVDPRRLDSFAGQRLAEREPDARSGPRGVFRIENLVAGERVHLFVRREGYVAVWAKGVEVSAEEPLTIVLQPGFTVAGKVVDSEGEPVADAELYLEQDLSPPERRVLRSGSQGRFAIEGLRPGAATLEVSHPAYVASDTISLTVGAATDELSVVLERGAVLEGRVATAGGEPVAEARVTAGSAAALTDASGIYRAEGVALGAATAEAHHPHYGRVLEETEIEDGVNTIDLTFPDGYSVSGQVVDEDGHGVADAEVSMVFEAGRGVRKYVDLSADDGAFLLRPVADGEYQLAVRKEGFAISDDSTVTVSGAAIEDLKLVLRRGTEVSGAILGLEFDELSRVKVQAERANGSSVPGRVDFEGRYEIRDLSPGGWLLQASLDVDRRRSQARIVIEPGDRKLERDLRFEEQIILTGLVLQEGDPLPDVKVSLDGIELAVSRSSVTDHRGRFRFEDLAAGVYRLGLAHGPSRLVYHQDVELGSDRDLVLDLRQARVSGRVVEAEQGLPVDQALVVLQRLGADGGVTNVLARGTGTEGTFEFQRVPEGNYRLSVRKDGYAADSRSLQVFSGDQIRGLELEVEATRGLELEVRWAFGGVPPIVTVLAYAAAADWGGIESSPAGLPALHESRAVDGTGRVHLPTVPAGSWLLLVGARGAVPARVTAQAPGPVVAVELTAAGSFDVRVAPLLTSDLTATLRVLGADGRALAGVDPAAGLIEVWRLVAGRVRVEGIPPGLWELQVTAADGRSWSASAVSTAHQTTVVPVP
jgi:protocatechuate 3,4-dioxygenase beta subunit